MHAPLSFLHGESFFTPLPPPIHPSLQAPWLYDPAFRTVCLVVASTASCLALTFALFGQGYAHSNRPLHVHCILYVIYARILIHKRLLRYAVYTSAFPLRTKTGVRFPLVLLARVFCFIRSPPISSFLFLDGTPATFTPEFLTLPLKSKSWQVT
jgi:hypothetical protein